MPLQVFQIIQRVQTNLFDAAGVFFDHDAIFDSIQDGYDEVVLDTQCIENVVTVPYSNNTLYYDLYDGIYPTNNWFWRISRIFNQNTKRWIPCVDDLVLDKFRFDWEASVGACWFAHIVNFQYLTFFPHLSTGVVGSFDVHYKVGRHLFNSDQDIPQIPDEFNRILESYATADLLEIYREFTKAAEYWDDYMKLKQKLRDYVPSRSLPSKIWQLNDLDWPSFGIP